jgi:hypothetical protein
MTILRDTKFAARFIVYILRHKWLVFNNCCKEGLWWRGLKHDLDKLQLSIMLPYARHWFGDAVTRINSKPKLLAARERHHRTQSHHWEYWLDKQGVPRDISTDALIELICDWRAVQTTGGKPPLEFLNGNPNIVMSEATRQRLVQGISTPPGCLKTILEP